MRCACEPPQGAGPLRGWVLDVLGLVEQEPVPGDRRECVDVARRDVVRGDDDVAGAGDRRQLLAAQPLAAVVQVHAERRREPLDLAGPLARDAHRADDEGGAERLGAELLPLGGQHRDRLHGLAEPHVVGEDGADPHVAEQPQPAVAALLEREERLRHRGGGAEGLVAPLVAAREQRAERVVERDLAELETRILQLDTRDRPDEVDDGSLAPAVEEEQGLLDLGAAQRVPAALDADQRLLGGRELGQLLLGEGRVADRELPVEPCEGVGREQSARRAGRARRGEVDAQPAGRADPVARQQHGHADLLQPRDRGAEHEANVVVAELERGRLDRVEGEAALGEDGLDQPELALHGDPRIGRAEEAEDRVTAVVQEGGGEGQGRIVGRLQPQLEHDGGRVAGLALARVALVEPEAEEPRCAGAALEAAVDPVGEPPLERTQPRMRRQLGLDRGEAVEEQLGCARPVAQEPVAEPHARRAEAVAGDLVDGAGVEVVHERVAVAVERVGADGRQRGSDCVERLLHRLVDRGAPVGEPRAPTVLELRVEEAFGDGSRGELEHGEGCARGAAELELGGRLLVRGRSAPRGRPGGRSRRARAPPDPRPRESRPATRRPRASRRGCVRARSR